MFPLNSIKPAVFGILLLLGSFALGQTQQQAGSLVVRGYSGQAQVVSIQGRAFVDVEALAQITSGSLGFNNGRIELTLPGASGTTADVQPAQPGFSRPFMTSGIETIASLREWGSALIVAIQNGFPIGNTMNVYRGRAMDSLRIASAAVATDSDRNGLELLRNEFNNVQAWSNKLVNARNTMSAADLTMSEDALKSDPMYQGIVQCGQFLGQMLAGGTFQDDASCH
jgi:hypothetical protein